MEIQTTDADVKMNSKGKMEDYLYKSCIYVYSYCLSVFYILETFAGDIKLRARYKEDPTKVKVFCLYCSI